MTKLTFIYEKNDDGDIRIQSVIHGNMVGVTSAVGKLIQMIHDDTAGFARPIFRESMRQLLAEDSTVWKPVEGVKVDLNALRGGGKT